MDYLTIRQVSEKWGVSIRRVQALCTSGRIDGVIKFGNEWAIPCDAERPQDQRIRSGKYIKREMNDNEK